VIDHQSTVNTVYLIIF